MYGEFILFSVLFYSYFFVVFFFFMSTALCSVDLSRQSRELMDECLDDLGNNPDRAISMVNDYLDNNNAVNDDDDGGGGSLAKNEMTNNNNQSMILPFTTSVSAIKNRRQSMEDRHIIIQNLNKALGLTVRILVLLENFLLLLFH